LFSNFRHQELIHVIEKPRPVVLSFRSAFGAQTSPLDVRSALCGRVLESRVLLSATLLVDHSNPADYQSIQSAVTAASPGNTIKVAPGTYNEDVTVSKPLTILGGQVLTSGESGPSTVGGFAVSSANDVTINGFTIDGDGIAATNSSHSKFDNNVFADSPKSR
jgi:pectin methylesterase-like acyl-CoA thioesterase